MNYELHEKRESEESDIKKDLKVVRPIKLLLSVREVCELLGIERKSLYRLVRTKEILPHPGFRKLLFHVGAIERFAALQPRSAGRRAA